MKKGIIIEERNDIDKYVLRYAKPGETKCIMILKDGTEFEVPIVRIDDGERK